MKGEHIMDVLERESVTNEAAETARKTRGGMWLNLEDGSHIDTVGALILGLMSLILLFAYMRAQGRNRKLMEKIAKLEKKLEKAG
jgi:hypothetical protein